MTDAAELTALLQSHPRFLVTADLTDEAVAALRTMGSVQLLGWAAGQWFAEPEEMLTAAGQADVLIAGYEPVTAALLGAVPSLRLIASVRSEPRANVDVKAATALGIPVLHTSGRTDQAVAEFTILVMLAMVRNLVPAVSWMRHRPDDFVPADSFYRSTVWGEGNHAPQLRFTGIEVTGRSLGVVGFGSIGRAVGRLATGLGMRVLVADPFVADEVIGKAGAVPLTLPELLPLADIVTLHARLGPSSRNLLGAEELALMRPGAYLINTGRAGLVDREALVVTLAAGRLGGVALDVFDEEPPAADDPLILDTRVLPTPHLAAWTRELTAHHSASILEELWWIAGGGTPRKVANPEVISVAEGASS